ncbi:MAG: RluA family pseudouridine synthase [Alphaproteobacteria bacterium]|nr:RluA family pseudouridine synthase [Alphaproteobacteria bacterium]
MCEVRAGEDDAGVRVDRWLAENIPGLSRSRIQTLIKAGEVRSGAATIGDVGERVKPGRIYSVCVPEALDPEPAGEDIALDVVFEDAHLIVINKPAGLVVHPAPGHSSGTLVNALIAHCGESLSGIGGVKRPGIVHRLDKDTSGLLVVAKTDSAHQALSDQFAEHGRDGRLHRAYLALAWGVPERPSGVIDAPLGRSQANRKKMAVVSEKLGRQARTHYNLVDAYDGSDVKGVASLMRMELETGRTHQIRVHLAHIRHPVMGDPVYGTGFKASARLLGAEARWALGSLRRQALHAAELGFEHPASGEPLRFEAQMPADMQRLVDALGTAKSAV